MNNSVKKQRYRAWSRSSTCNFWLHHDFLSTQTKSNIMHVSPYSDDHNKTLVLQQTLQTYFREAQWSLHRYLGLEFQNFLKKLFITMVINHVFILCSSIKYIHTSPREGIGISWGFCKSRTFKEMYEAGGISRGVRMEGYSGLWPPFPSAARETQGNGGRVGPSKYPFHAV